MDTSIAEHSVQRLNSGLTQVLDDGTNTYLYGLGRIAQTQGAATDYFLSDALGSVRQLTDQTGAVTYARAYDPYGVVTAATGASGTPYGYTGEYTSNDLVYLRARHYDPAMGRFLTRDTWRGDVNMPMSFNAWNYVSGNPVNRLDPTGMCWVDIGDISVWIPDGSPACRYSYPVYPDKKDFAQLFGITFVNQWDDVDLEAARQAAIRVGEKFVASQWGGDPIQAFRQVYGINNSQTMLFTWNSGCTMCKPAQCRPTGNAANKDYSDDILVGDKDGDGKPDYMQIQLINGGTAPCACKPKGGYTHGEHSIEFASLWPNYTNHGSYIQMLRKVNNIIHELGHAFNQRAYQDPQNKVASYSENVNDDLFYLTNRSHGFYADQYGTMTWVQSTETSGSEVFADMFLGWVYGKWAADDYGKVRRNFMEQNMSGWIASAKGKP